MELHEEDLMGTWGLALTLTGVRTMDRHLLRLAHQLVDDGDQVSPLAYKTKVIPLEPPPTTDRRHYSRYQRWVRNVLHVINFNLPNSAIWAWW